MRDLEPTDPRRIGGYRLLRRLAEGRTGRLYYAASLGGVPTALKVIGEEHAADADFRARFERDVSAARHVAARWLITVSAADTAGATSWAAFPFVAGPPLDGTVAAHGPLPSRSVRVLGARLAEALQAVHGAGLTHRDVRPGHVLLTPDGPWLTGFGGSGTLAGPPGFVSPEQALGDADRTGPPSDIFSLGCVLAYAATGRSPFGKGAEADLLLRALHEPPDLADVPRGLLEVVRACLEHDPLPRPTAADLRAELAVDDVPGWLPGPVALEVAERCAAPLPVPDPHMPPPAEENGPGAPQGPAARRSLGRRGVLLLGGTGALAAAAGLGVWRIVHPSSHEAVAEEGAQVTLALHADLTGPYAGLGRGQLRGVSMAVDELRTMGNLPFRLALRHVDDRGDPGLATELAAELAADPTVMAVIGPTADAIAPLVAGIYAEAGVPLLALSVGSVEPRDGFGTLLHARPSTGHSSLAIPVHLAETVEARRVGLVDDRGADLYSARTTRAVSGTIDRELIDLLPRVLPAGTEDFGPVAAEFVAAGVDAVVYGGFARGAGRLARALADEGFDGTGIATQEAMGPDFFAEAGDAGNGWWFIATYTDPVADDSARGFASVHRQRYGDAAEPYAAEAYDLARLTVEGMRGVVEGGDALGRGGLLDRLRSSRYRGVARELAFDQAGDYAGAGPMAYLYEASSGSARFRGPAPFPS
ncbi:bifunctional serine/threonine-protein kinase/ABC transporter substrate-binding protein [Streptomyces radicis]|uniref:Serine/threonine protein kinase n=1 Tax=Streptomyces radicis TaxID=1750517 RepID=A0A3A9WB94_9ACTN|nr:bifunctional serine/threonine-protein kinase/ABC transporter substrate-binding protein [Streptomyces radicis]RKN10591.1 serine/threonine protein kinase [Streptomyces radicis]RKN24851.1 serine/threonine protein kinase [Streptomyces radicis]